jgi:hypothetical protein
MDIVYPLANLSKFKNDLELRYSLRSLDCQPWVDRVFLIGHRPVFVKDIIHIPCGDPYKNCKDANIINKILRACQEDVSDRFVVNSDDQIFLQEVAESDMSIFIENPDKTIEYKIKSRTNNWHKRVFETVQWCFGSGFAGHVFQSHTPYIIDKKLYPAVMSQVAWGRGNGFTTHIYFNITEKSPGLEPKNRTARVRHPISIKKVYRAVDGRKFLNFNNSGFDKGVMSYLQEKFPNRSRWEK